MRYEELVRQELETLKKSGIIDIDKIMDIDLYIDQVESFFNTQLKDIYDETNKWHVTRTMINNYAKYSIIPRAEGKKYTRDHLIMLAMVLYLKGIFKIDDIEVLMKSLVENHASVFEDTIDPEILYSTAVEVNRDFVEDFTDSVTSDVKSIKKLLEDTDIADDDRMEILTLILSLAMKADMQKLMAQKLLRAFFVDPAIEKKASRKEKIKKPKDNRRTRRDAADADL
ncbi:MAG: DUF1836 domain-containing protein [Clostridia bacterium]|nr:DUF1836 domain-containing protein [Clostridia bacterium]